MTVRMMTLSKKRNAKFNIVKLNSDCCYEEFRYPELCISILPLLLKFCNSASFVNFLPVKLPRPPSLNYEPQQLGLSSNQNPYLFNSVHLIKLLIKHFLVHKYFCVSKNKSVFSWSFLSVTQVKNPIIILTVIMPSVVVLTVMAPHRDTKSRGKKSFSR